MLIHSVSSLLKKSLSKHTSLKINQEWHVTKSSSDVDYVMPFGKCGFPKHAPKRCPDISGPSPTVSDDTTKSLVAKSWRSPNGVESVKRGIISVVSYHRWRDKAVQAFFDAVALMGSFIAGISSLSKELQLLSHKYFTKNFISNRQMWQNHITFHFVVYWW